MRYYSFPMRTLLSLLVFVLGFNAAFGQSLTTTANTLNFGSNTESSVDSLWVLLQNQGSKTAYINGYRSWWRFGGEVCWIKDSVFSIAPSGQHGLYVYFRPHQNINYSLPLVLLTDSHFGAIPIELQGQGSFSNTYYNSTQNLEGQSLKQAFSTLLAQNYNSVSYNTARDEMYADLDNVGGNVTCVYTGRTATFNDRPGANANNINCEHTMPQSTFGSSSPMQSDIHHLFPSDASANSVRSNHPFAIVNNPTWSVGGSKYGSSKFEPRDVQKGNSARALLYFALRYGDYGGFIAGMESTLLAWHLQDQPDAFEKGRNNGIYQIQNNRNPLVDYPQFSERLASFTGSPNLSPTSSWAVYPDTLWIQNGQEACLSIVNTGDQTLSLTSIGGTTSDFSLSGLPSSLNGMNATCIQVNATGNQDFGPIALSIQSSSHPNKTAYIASKSSSGVSPVVVPSLDGLAFDSLSTQTALLDIDKPMMNWGSDWDGVVVFASEQAFQPFFQNNSRDASSYTASNIYGQGSQVVANGSQNGFCIYNSSLAGDEQLLIMGLNPNTTYYVQAFVYKEGSAAIDDFSYASNTQTTTMANVVIGGPGNCDGGLIISEYIEGSSSNKCLELTNTSDTIIDLSLYKLYLTSNANTLTTHLNLSGSLAVSESYVLCNSQADNSFLLNADIQINGGVVNHNGDDLNSLVEIATGDTIDRVGNPNNLGANHTIVYNGATIDIKDVTLVRADSVLSGIGPWSRTRKQWHPLPNNTADSLGSHSFQICVNSAAEIPYTYTPFGDRYGESVALHANFAVVSSPGRAGYFSEAHDTASTNGPFNDMGAAYIFKKQNGAWVEWQRLEALDRDEDDEFGFAMALGDSILAIGAASEGNQQEGKVYLFHMNHLNQWLSFGELEYPLLNPNDEFGYAIALDEDQLAISAPGGNGAVYMYELQANSWILADILQPNSVSIGSSFGTSLHLQSDTLIVGAPKWEDKGRVFIYVKNNGLWSLEQELTASDAQDGRRFGQAVGRWGADVFVGDPTANKVYVFLPTSFNWIEGYGIQPPFLEPGDFFGAQIAIDPISQKIAVGSEAEGQERGQVFVLSKTASVWTQNTQFWALDSSSYSRYGHALSVYDNEVLAGAPLMNQSTYRVSSVDRGAAFFTPLGSSSSLPVNYIQPGQIEPAFDPQMNDLLAASLQKERDILIYPNPSRGLITIGSSKAFTLRILDISGRLVKEYQIEEHFQPTSIDISTLAPAVYLIQMKTATGSPQLHRLIKY